MTIATTNAKLRHNEYYGQQSILDELYEQSLKGTKFKKLHEKIIAEGNILLAYYSVPFVKTKIISFLVNQIFTIKISVKPLFFLNKLLLASGSHVFDAAVRYCIH